MDTGKIKEIISIFEQSSLSGMELEADDLKIKLSKEAPVVSLSSPAISSQPSSNDLTRETQVQEEEAHVQGEHVRSPLVGTFYAAASEGASPFVKVGDSVEKGDILCIIEAMKVMNEIHAPCSGIVKAIFAEDGAMVQFDEELMVIGA